MRAIASGLSEPGEHLRAARAVRSGDFSRLYFVSADIEGPGMRAKTEIATWATNRLDGTGLIYSVDDFAVRFSDWGDGARTDAHITLADSGAQESRRCTADALG